MDIDWSVEVVDQVESHWRHRLRPRLQGLTDDEYFWQPVPDCWTTISRRGESSAPVSFGTGEFTMDYSPPPHERESVTTIAWRPGHLIVGFASTNGEHFGRPASSESTFLYPGTAGEALRQLDDEYEHWANGVRSLGTAGLARPQGYPPAFAHAPLAKKMLYVTSRSSTTAPRSACSATSTCETAPARAATLGQPPPTHAVLPISALY